MTFRPINARNAVLEAIVLLGFDRQFTADEREAAKATHSSSLSLDLPKLEEQPGFAVYVGSDTPQGGPPPFPFYMAAYQRDGRLEARLMVGPNFLAANFLLYTRWQDHWQKAASWFRKVGEAMLTVSDQVGTPPLSVSGCAHQMIDVFPWNGDPLAIAANLLVTKNAKRLPLAGLETVGAPWSSLHVSAFIGDQGAVKGAQVSDRLTCEIAQEAGVGWRLRLDHLQEMTLPQPLALSLSNPDNHIQIGTVVDELHQRNRVLLRSMLSPSMLALIGLEVS